jgi:ferric-dicitrate binding protein FerR (iron transport regulator)
MISDINNILLIKYLRNELSEAELKIVLRWLEENEENKEFLFGLKEVYMLSRWEELHARSEAAEGWKDLHERIGQSDEQRRSPWRRRAIQYAAAAVVIFMLGFILRDLTNTEKITYNMVETKNGEQSTLFLNDGTKVKLNENSKLIYPSNFAHNTRNVELKGEAYFEVEHNPKQPFLVNIGTYTVKVLGTKFNIDAYPDQIYVYTSLKEGRIQIVDNTPEAKIVSELKPGMQLSYNKRTGEFFVKAVDTEQVADWTSGQVVIKRQTLEELVQRLEQKYHYTMNIENQQINKLTYNITIDKEPMEEILSNIHFITPQVHYSINNKDKTVILK